METALAAYRNADDGYGHALEPDLRGPVSQPLHTGHALHVLDSIGRCGGQRVERVCRYLTSVSTPDGALPAVHPSQRGYPAAPFVPIVDDPPSDLLATGPVVGLLHRNQVWHAWLFRATDFCWQAVESLEKSHPYEVQAAVAFLDVRARPPARPGRRRPPRPPGARTPARRAGPGAAERRTRCPPVTRRASTTSRTTSRTPRNPWRARGSPTRRCPVRLDFLAGEQQEDGGWPIRWRSGPRAPPWRAARS